MNNQQVELDFSAEDARALAADYSKIKIALKTIKEEAVFGLYECFVNCLTVKDIDSLTELGYKVEFDGYFMPIEEMKKYKVSW